MSKRFGELIWVTPDTPEWLKTYVPHVVRCLGAEDWLITIKVEWQIDDGDSKACVSQDHSNHRICFQASREFLSADTPDARAVVIHEVLHTIHSDVEGVAERVIETLPDKRMRKAWDTTFEIANERFIRPLAELLVPLIGDPPEES